MSLSRPRPFDLAALKAQAQASLYSGGVPFDPAVPVSPEEARFWLIVHSRVFRHATDRAADIKRIRADECARPLALDEVKQAGADMLYWDVNLPTLLLQRAWLPPADLVEAVAANQNTRLNAANAAGMADWLGAHLFPTLDAAAMESVRERLRALLRGDAPHVAAILARHAGMQADLAAWADGLKKNSLPPAAIAAGFAVALFGIGPGLVDHFRRLGLRLATLADAREWRKLTGDSALDLLGASVLGQRKAADQLALLDVLLEADSPDAAPVLLEVKAKAKPPEAASRIDAW
ncbi:MAG: hypothetical protein K2W96_24185, partial [Gemmataceae bacterium]|nr:hypothetical protein [Gemmataceae bacterium]